MKFYTGIGSRETPENILNLMTDIAIYLGKKDYIMRSGGADGADTAFYNGAKDYKFELYYPWPNFFKADSKNDNPDKEAFELAKEYHPAFNFLSYGAKKLHARNCYQVLGLDLNTPSKFIIAYTKNAELKGGTATALKIAQAYDIKIYNLGNQDIANKWAEYIQ